MELANLRKAIQLAKSLYDDNEINLDGVKIRCYTINRSDITVGEWGIWFGNDMSMNLTYNDRAIASNIDMMSKVRFVEDDGLYELGLYPKIFKVFNEMFYDGLKDFDDDIKNLQNLYNYEHKKAV